MVRRNLYDEKLISVFEFDFSSVRSLRIFYIHILIDLERRASTTASIIFFLDLRATKTELTLTYVMCTVI